MMRTVPSVFVVTRSALAQQTAMDRIRKHSFTVGLYSRTPGWQGGRDIRRNTSATANLDAEARCYLQLLYGLGPQHDLVGSEIFLAFGAVRGWCILRPCRIKIKL
jgi:hypothetical protein